MTAILVSVAELSNIFSVLAVLICFCGVFLFIMRYVYARHSLLLFREQSHASVSIYLPDLELDRRESRLTLARKQSSHLSPRDTIS